MNAQRLKSLAGELKLGDVQLCDDYGREAWLDAKTYGPAARKSWIAVVGYVDQSNDVTQVCEGTSKKDDLGYYYERKRRTGDFHGQAPVMWAASALLRNGEKEK